MGTSHLNAAHTPAEKTKEHGALWPNFYIVGGVKCGTTSLWAHLKAHPQIFMPEVKEPHFFVTLRPTQRERYTDLWINDVESYQQLYRKSGDAVAIGDASPSYLWDQEAAGRIHEVCPQARIVIMLRDPVERAYSHFLMQTMGGYEKRSLFDALQQDYSAENRGWWISNLYVELGLYHEQVRRYLEVFRPGQVLICMFNELKDDSNKLFVKLANHIGVDPAPFQNMVLDQAFNTFRKPKYMRLRDLARTLIPPSVRSRLFGRSLRRKLMSSKLLFSGEKPALDQQSRSFLQNIYGPDLDRLEELLGRKLPELRKSWV